MSSPVCQTCLIDLYRKMTEQFRPELFDDSEIGYCPGNDLLIFFCGVSFTQCTQMFDSTDNGMVTETVGGDKRTKSRISWFLVLMFSLWCNLLSYEISSKVLCWSWSGLLVVLESQTNQYDRGYNNLLAWCSTW